MTAPRLVTRLPWPRDPSITVGDDGSITGVKLNHSHSHYARFRHGGQWVYAHRVVCETFHGPAPAPGMFALHENDVPDDNRPENLRWGTRRCNGADAVRNGRYRGHGSPLKENDVRAIRDLCAWGMSGAEIGRHYGVSRQAVNAIKLARSWRS